MENKAQARKDLSLDCESQRSSLSIVDRYREFEMGRGFSLTFCLCVNAIAEIVDLLRDSPGLLLRRVTLTAFLSSLVARCCRFNQLSQS